MSVRSVTKPVLMAAGFLAFLWGCGDKKKTFTIDGPSGHTLKVAQKPFSVQFLTPDGRTLTSIESGGLGIGRVPAFSENHNYDPYLMVFDFLNGPHDPPGLMWVSVREVRSHRVEGDTNLLDVRMSDGSSATLRISSPIPGVFELLLDVPDADAEVQGEPAVVFTYVDLWAPEGEGYYGGGQVFHSVAHRGKQIAMQMAMTDTESFNNEAHVRIPLVVSSGGWGAFFNSMRPGYLDFAASDPETIRTVVNDSALTFYLMAGSDPLEVTEQYTALTANPAIPPVWAFAPIQWRNEVSGQDEVLQDATDIRLNEVPTGAIWVDRPYQTTYNSMDFDPLRYPDPPAMVSALHRLGFRLAGWNSPYLEEDDPDYAMAEQNGWFAEGTFVFQDFGKFLDLTHPDAMSFWQARVSDAFALGIEGWKLDYAEDIQIGLSDSRLHFSFYSGEDERTMNRRYAEYYHRAYAEPLGLPEVFILVRAGTIGGQQYASVVWPGDLCSNFRDFGDIDHEGTVHVGGLPSAVRAGIGLSVSGYPFFASDIGGFRHHRPTHEVMVRWTQYAALMPVMQYGGGGDNHNPWDFTPDGESVFTQETLDIFKRYATLHIRLFPYFYTLARAAHATGRPVVRPFGLSYPEDGRHPDDAFLSGPDLLVAPVIQSATQRTVPIPPGEWIDWWTGEVLTGPADETVDAPLDKLPLYMRMGGIVPMLRPTVQTLSPVSEPGIDSTDGNPGRLWGRVAPAQGVVSMFVLHDDGELTVEGSTDGSARVEFNPGTLYAGLRLQVFVPQTAVVERNGSQISQVSTAQELDTCPSCWYKAGSEPWVWIALSEAETGPQTFTLR